MNDNHYRPPHTACSIDCSETHCRQTHTLLLLLAVQIVSFIGTFIYWDQIDPILGDRLSLVFGLFTLGVPGSIAGTMLVIVAADRVKFSIYRCAITGFLISIATIFLVQWWHLR